MTITAAFTLTSTQEENGTLAGFQAVKRSVPNVMKATILPKITNVKNCHSIVNRPKKMEHALNAIQATSSTLTVNAFQSLAPQITVSSTVTSTRTETFSQNGSPDARESANNVLLDSTLTKTTTVSPFPEDASKPTSTENVSTVVKVTITTPMESAL